MKQELKTRYSQRDSRWASILLGFNTEKQYTLGNYGCLVTTLCNYLNATGWSEIPATVNEKLKINKGFVNGGYLDFGVFERTFNLQTEYQLVWTDKSLTETQITGMRKLVEQGYYLVCEVDFNPLLTGEQMHWVGVFGWDKNGAIILDPWTGTEVPLSIYGDVKKSVFSYRAYNKTLIIEAMPVEEDYKQELEDMRVSRDAWKKQCETFENALADARKDIEDLQAQVKRLQTAIAEQTPSITDFTTPQLTKELISRLKVKLLEIMKKTPKVGE